MRSPDEQEDFLEHGRFGVDGRKPGSIDPWFLAGLILIISGIAVGAATRYLKDSGNHMWALPVILLYAPGVLIVVAGAICCFIGVGRRP